MLDANQVIEKMSERGFTQMSRGMRGNETISIYFVSEPTLRTNGQDIHIPSIGCNVFLETEEFELMYAVPQSINVLRTANKCGSFMNDKHFDNLCGKLENQAGVLYRAFGR